ncbi:hypothetical protein B0H13DRAFT_1951912 [Mycena leptocephala]|nr:hypothetical protein B0H13DRAFT_1951912 [Mycena leptocephala]
MAPRKSPTPSQVLHDRATLKVLRLDPLNDQYRNIKKQFSDRQEASKELEYVRNKIEMTINRDIEKVFVRLPLGAEEKEKLYLIRRFFREFVREGKTMKPFWRNLDVWFTAKRLVLGATFETVAWRTYIEEDEKIAARPARAPLFTSLPLRLTPRSSVASSASNTPSHESLGPVVLEDLVDDATTSTVECSARSAPAPGYENEFIFTPPACLKLSYILN